MKKILNNLFAGLLLISAGVGYLGNAVGWWSGFTVFFDGWWTLFLIIPAVFGFINNGFDFFNSMLFIVGGALLVSRHVGDNYKDSIWWIVLAVLLLLLGLIIIFRPLIKKRRLEKLDFSNQYSDSNDYRVSFSEKKFNYDGREFTGIHVKVEFGSATVDLRGATINSDCVVHADVSFAGMTILLPANVRFINDCSASFGGVSVKRSDAPVGAPTVCLKGQCGFGGIEIKG